LKFNKSVQGLPNPFAPTYVNCSTFERNHLGNLHCKPYVTYQHIDIGAGQSYDVSFLHADLLVLTHYRNTVEVFLPL